ncbi:MAG: HAD-IA family hydrolase [Candidatus Bilamarchaeaceae archaeon]
MKSRIRAIFLDLDDTLYDFSKASSKAMEEVYQLVIRRYGNISLTDLEDQYAKILSKVEEDAFLDGRTGNEYRTERFIVLLSQFGIHDDRLVKEMVDVYGDTLEKNLYLFSGVSDELIRLKSNFDLYLITDGPEDAQKKAIKILGIDKIFKGVFISGACKKIKSDGGLFSHALEKTGLNADEVIMVGDSYERDIIGAFAAGIESIWVNKKGEKAPSEVAKPRAVIKNVNELDGCLDKIFKKKIKIKLNIWKHGNERPVLILGHPRSGTNFLATILGSEQTVNAIIEPFSLHCKFAIDNECRYWGADDFDPILFHRELSNMPEATKYFGEFRDWLYAKSGELRLFKETMFFLQMEWLSHYLPDIKIIYLERDPKAVIASYKKDRLFEKWDYERRFRTLAEEVKKKRQLASYKSLFENASTATQVEKLAIMWYIRISEARKNLFRFDHVAVSYENVIKNPYEMFKRLSEFSGIRMTKKMKEAINERSRESRGSTYSTYRDPIKSLERWKNTLNDFEKKAISRIVKDVPKLRERYGRKKLTY